MIDGHEFINVEILEIDPTIIVAQALSRTKNHITGIRRRIFESPKRDRSRSGEAG